MGVTHLSCGADRWDIQTAIVDCYDREVTGFHFAFARSGQGSRARFKWPCLAASA
jgi:hypothetical protein